MHVFVGWRYSALTFMILATHTSALGSNITSLISVSELQSHRKPLTDYVAFLLALFSIRYDFFCIPHDFSNFGNVSK